MTLLDFPGRVACIVFTQGCNLRCGYCHNPQLISRRPVAGATSLSEDQIFAFLKKRRNVLDAVVVSGGEPTIQPDLIAFLRRVKQLGFLVKLDTNGTNPAVLREALNSGLLDYVAMDVKHDPVRYAEIAGIAVDPNVLSESRDLLLHCGIDHEFRTTVVPGIHDAAVIEKIARFCEDASRFVLQSFRPNGVADPTLHRCLSPSIEQLKRLKWIAEHFISNVVLVDNNSGDIPAADKLVSEKGEPDLLTPAFLKEGRRQAGACPHGLKFRGAFH